MKYCLKSDFKKQQARDRLEQLIKQEKDIELKEIKRKRNLSQNNLYWLWLTAIESETGYTKERLHLMYRAKFLQKDSDHITKVIYPDLWEKVKVRVDNFLDFEGLEDIINIVSESTTQQDTGSMSKYMNKIQDHAQAAMNVTLLSLDDKHFWDFYDEYKINM